MITDEALTKGINEIPPLPTAVTDAIDLLNNGIPKPLNGGIIGWSEECVHIRGQAARPLPSTRT